MATQIIRSGDTLTVEIPQELLTQASLPVGEPLEWVANGEGSIALVKNPSENSKNPRRRKTLDEILEGIPEGACVEDVDWGPARAAEVW